MINLKNLCLLLLSAIILSFTTTVTIYSQSAAESVTTTKTDFAINAKIIGVADPNYKEYTYVDIGKAHGIKQGDRFLVDGKYGKVMVEVVQPFQRMSAVKIVDSWLLQEGNKGATVAETMYSKVRVRKFQQRPVQSPNKTPINKIPALAIIKKPIIKSTVPADLSVPILPGDLNTGAEVMPGLETLPGEAEPSLNPLNEPALPPADMNAEPGLPPADMNAEPGLPPADMNAEPGLPPADMNAEPGLPPADMNTEPGLPPEDMNAEPGLPPADMNAEPGLPPADMNAEPGLPPADMNAEPGLPPADMNAEPGLPSDSTALPGGDLPEPDLSSPSGEPGLPGEDMGMSPGDALPPLP